MAEDSTGQVAPMDSYAADFEPDAAPEATSPPTTAAAPIAEVASNRPSANGRVKTPPPSELVLPEVLPPIRKTSSNGNAKPRESPNGNMHLPAIKGPPSGKQMSGNPYKSKIPSASPTRLARPSGRSRIPAAHSDMETSPKSDGYNSNWNQFNRDTIKPRQQILITGPSEEERAKRRQWALEKRQRDEAKARIEVERKQAEDQLKRETEEARLESRRAAVRERIARSHEIAAKLAAERSAADERARQEMERFHKGKPLYEKIIEEFEEQQKQEVAEKRRLYDEEIAKMKNVRPHQIIAGEVVVKPPPRIVEDPRDASAGRGVANRKSPGRSSYPHPPMGILSGGGAHASIFGNPGGNQGEPGSDPAEVIKTRSVKPQPREHKKALGHGRQHESQVVERAISPFVFNSEQWGAGPPVNVPDQTVFWAGHSKVKPNILTMEEPPMAAVLEEADAPQMDSPKALPHPYPGPSEVQLPEAANETETEAEELAPATEAEESAAAPEVEEPAAAPEAEELAAAPEVEEPAAAPEVEESAAAPEAEESAAAPEVEEPAAAPEAEELAPAPEVEESAAAPEAEELAPAPEADGLKGASVVQEEESSPEGEEKRASPETRGEQVAEEGGEQPHEGESPSSKENAGRDEQETTVEAPGGEILDVAEPEGEAGEGVAALGSNAEEETTPEPGEPVGGVDGSDEVTANDEVLATADEALAAAEEALDGGPEAPPDE